MLLDSFTVNLIGYIDCIGSILIQVDMQPVAMSSADGLEGTGFASRYQLQPRVFFKGPVDRCKTTTPSSLSLTSNRAITNC